MITTNATSPDSRLTDRRDQIFKGNAVPAQNQRTPEILETVRMPNHSGENESDRKRTFRNDPLERLVTNDQIHEL